MNEKVNEYGIVYRYENNLPVTIPANQIEFINSLISEFNYSKTVSLTTDIEINITENGNVFIYIECTDGIDKYSFEISFPKETPHYSIYNRKQRAFKKGIYRNLYKVLLKA